jgi:hypothetical protein
MCCRIVNVLAVAEIPSQMLLGILRHAHTHLLTRAHRHAVDHSQVEAALGVPVSQQRYWAWQVRQNKTVRPTTRLKDDDKTIILDLKEYRDTGVSQPIAHVSHNTDSISAALRSSPRPSPLVPDTCSMCVTYL